MPLKKNKTERVAKDPSQYNNKVIINNQAYFTDSIKINQVNSNVIIQNRNKSEGKEEEQFNRAV